MLTDFITRILILILGYACPAFECYKTMEKRKVEKEELRFWCQYWILVALLTVFERVADIFVSWLPLYSELKVALLLYLWYPKTKGTSYVYETLLQPYLADHETDIDEHLSELRTKAWLVLINFWQTGAKSSQETLAQTFQFLFGQFAKLTNATNQPRKGALSFLGLHEKQQGQDRKHRSRNRAEALHDKNATILDEDSSVHSSPIAAALSRLRGRKPLQ